MNGVAAQERVVLFDLELFRLQLLVAGGGIARRRFAFFARLGAFSYSLYAIHLPLFICLQAVFFRSALQFSIWPSLAFMPVALTAAYLFYQCVELPAIRWSTGMKRRKPSGSA